MPRYEMTPAKINAKLDAGWTLCLETNRLLKDDFNYLGAPVTLAISLTDFSVDEYCDAEGIM